MYIPRVVRMIVCYPRWETPPATVNAYYNPARNQISKSLILFFNGFPF